MGSLKDKSAIVKIDTSALIKKFIALPVDRELDFCRFEVRKEQEKEGKERGVAKEMGSCHLCSFHPWDLLTSGQCVTQLV